MTAHQYVKSVRLFLYKLCVGGVIESDAGNEVLGITGN